jgi:hypothetical protein
MPEPGGQQNTEKAALETEKLTLEKRLLQRQLSRQGLVLSWLQATSVPVALLGATSRSSWDPASCARAPTIRPTTVSTRR